MESSRHFYLPHNRRVPLPVVEAIATTSIWQFNFGPLGSGGKSGDDGGPRLIKVGGSRQRSNLTRGQPVSFVAASLQASHTLSDGALESLSCVEGTIVEDEDGGLHGYLLWLRSM